MGNLLARARQSGFVTVDASGHWSLVPGTADKLGFPREREAQFRREQQSLAASLRDYSVQQFALNWDDEQARDTLLEYVDANGSTLLTSAIRGGEASGETSRSTGANHVVVASWIDEVLASDPAQFEYLVSLVKGSMLATGLFLPGGLEVERPFVNTSLYLDTPLVLKALGYEGAAQTAAVRDTLALASAQDAGLRVFDTTLREARNVLLTAAANIGRGLTENPRAVDRHALDMRWSRSDLELKAERLESDMGRLKIEVRSRPDHVAALTVDETALEELLERNVRYSAFGQNARRHDLDALTAVYRRRGRNAGDRLETSRAVFITTNEAVVRTARRFDGFPRSEWPVAMVQQDVATILWAKKPMQAPDLPRHQVAAACASVLNPDPSLWRKYIDEVERLAESGEISDDDVTLLRYHQEARRALVKKTLGAAEEVDPDLVQKVLEVAQTAIRAPLEGQLEILSAEQAATVTAAANTELSLTTDLQHAQAEARAHREEAERLRAESVAVIDLERARSRRDGDIIRWTVGVLIAALLAASLILTSGPIVKIGTILLAAGAFLGNLTQVGKRCGDFIARKSFVFRLGRLNLTDTAEARASGEQT